MGSSSTRVICSQHLRMMRSRIQPSGCCFLPHYLAMLTTNRVKISTGLLFYAYKTNLWKFELNWSSKLRDKERKNALVTRSCVSSDAWFWNLEVEFWVLELKIQIFQWNIRPYTSFSKTTPLQGSRFPHNVLYTINSSPFLVTIL